MQRSHSVRAKRWSQRRRVVEQCHNHYFRPSSQDFRAWIAESVITGAESESWGTSGELGESGEGESDWNRKIGWKSQETIVCLSSESLNGVTDDWCRSSYCHFLSVKNLLLREASYKTQITRSCETRCQTDCLMFKSYSSFHEWGTVLWPSLSWGDGRKLLHSLPERFKCSMSRHMGQFWEESLAEYAIVSEQNWWARNRAYCFKHPDDTDMANYISRK